MQLDKNFEDSLAGLLVAALGNDVEDVHECAAYVAKRLEGHGAQNCADRLRRILGGGDFIDGVWTPERWADDWCNLDDDDRLYSVYETKRLAEYRNVREPPSVLAPEQRATVKEILNVARSRLQQGEPHSTCMLAFGTAVQEPFDLALYIARKLGVECFLVEFSGPHEARVGRWSGQLHRLCEFAAQTPLVLVLRMIEDACNSVYVEDSWRVAELKCIRDRFLKRLSMLGTPTVVVACTNMEMNLDAGDWERFDYQMELNAAEPKPWLMVFRSFALGDQEGMGKAIASLPAKDRENVPPSTDS